MLDADAPIAKIQRLIGFALPAIGVALLLRLVVLATIRGFFFMSTRVSHRFALFLHVCGRIERAGERAGLASSALCVLAAGALHGGEVWYEVETCAYAANPRAHALVITAAGVLLLSTAHISTNICALAALMLMSRASPLAWQAVCLGVLELTRPHGFAYEVTIMLAYVSTLVSTSTHINACGKRFGGADATLAVLSSVGLGLWTATCLLRTIAEKRWKRAQPDTARMQRRAAKPH